MAIIGVLAGLMLPAMSRARDQAKSTVCATRLRTVGQGLVLYANENEDVLVPGRMPKVDSEQWAIRVEGGLKYRPSFLAMMATQLGLPPFDDPQPTKNIIDRYQQPGDRQNYSNEFYVCPVVPTWTDERNGCYGYNYQFLGNARLLDSSDPTSFKNWPVRYSKVRIPAECVAVADSLGTAASFPVKERTSYEDNLPGDSASGRSVTAVGNEGFNLDPPCVDPDIGEMAWLKESEQARTAIHERHRGRGNVLWVDGHCSEETLESLGYNVNKSGVVEFDGDNRLFSINHREGAWVDPVRSRNSGAINP